MSVVHKQLGLNSVEVSTKAPLDLHPDVLSAHQDDLVEVLAGDVQHTAASYAYAKAHQALADVYEWHVAVTDAEKEFAQLGYVKSQYTGREMPTYLHNGKTKHSHGREKDVYTAAQDSMVGVGTRGDALRKELEAFRDNTAKAIAKEMEAPELKTPFGIAVAQSTWAHLRDMKDGTNQNQKVPASAMRGDFLQKAIEAGDRLSVMSILNAPAYLTGLTEQQQAVYRRLAADNWAPKESRQLRAINTIIEKVMRAQATMLKRVNDLSETVGVVSVQDKAANKALAALKNRKAG